jgi:hypothetical protein
MEEYQVNPVIYKKYKDKYNEMSDKDKDILFDSMSWFFLPDGVKKRVRYKIEDKLKYIDKLSIIIGVIGTIANVCSSYLYIDFRRLESEDSKIKINQIR